MLEDPSRCYDSRMSNKDELLFIGETESPFQLTELGLMGQTLQVSGAGVTAIVGGNNVGKSSLLSQLDQWLHKGPGHISMNSQVSILSGLKTWVTEDMELFFRWIKRTSLETDSSHLGMGVRYFRNGSPGIDDVNIRQVHERAKTGDLGDFYPHFVFYESATNRSNLNFTIGKRERPDSPPSHPLHYLEDDPKLRDEVCLLFFDVFNQNLTLDNVGNAVTLRVGVEPVGLRELRIVDENLIRVRKELDRLPLLEVQGDGMKSFMWLVLAIVTSVYSVIILDEPEVFLHPPQAVKFGRILGDLSRKRNVQIVVATHDRNILIGLLQSECPLSIARLTRVGDVNSVDQLNPVAISEIWRDPVLRYSNILDGLFHNLVVVAEGSRDCTFYAAAIDHAHDQSQLEIAPSEILFVPSNGKTGIRSVADALAKIKVPVVASVDFDIFNDETVLSSLVESLKGDWSIIREDFKHCHKVLNQPREGVLVSDVVESVLDLLNKVLDENGERRWDSEMKRKFRALTRGGESAWDRLKKSGVFALPKEVETRFLGMMETLEGMGLVAVRTGELESFGLGYGIPEGKGLAWIRSALEADAHKSAAATEHVRRCVRAGVTLAARQADTQG
ncbi:ATP-binding protein [Actinosynnema sp. NPDC020468]|uniref:AAA family ATPase n=1 Tax=Actinosynnema sp. NPDC020468 TaxID=3154488 RepID=UPI0033C5D8E7